jgi:hypothetical protein
MNPAIVANMPAGINKIALRPYVDLTEGRTGPSHLLEDCLAVLIRCKNAQTVEAPQLRYRGQKNCLTLGRINMGIELRSVLLTDRFIKYSRTT